MSQVKTVTGFKPSQNGFRFANSFIDVPYDFKVVGDAHPHRACL